MSRGPPLLTQKKGTLKTKCFGEAGLRICMVSIILGHNSMASARLGRLSLMDQPGWEEANGGRGKEREILYTWDKERAHVSYLTLI